MLSFLAVCKWRLFATSRPNPTSMQFRDEVLLVGEEIPRPKVNTLRAGSGDASGKAYPDANSIMPNTQGPPGKP